MSAASHSSRNGGNATKSSAAATTRSERAHSKSSASAIPVPTQTNNSIAQRRKSLLPQRSAPIRDRREGPQQAKNDSRAEPPQKPPTDPEPSDTPADSHRPNTSSPSTTDRSLASQEESKEQAPRTRSDSTTTTSARPTSPTKSKNVNSRPALPSLSSSGTTAAKTRMSPPSRPARSASLRQPSAPKISTAVQTKGHTRHRSQVIGSAAAAQAPKPSEPPSPATPRAQQRPPFSTWQQHFSPKKESRTNEQPASSNRPRDQSNKSELIPASRPDIAALQTELLQLMLLHASIREQDAEWQRACEEELRKQFESVARTYQSLRVDERDAQRRLNLQALHSWSQVARHGDFAAQIQTLSRVIQDVSDLLNSDDGRYTHVVAAFEDWLDTVQKTKARREEPLADPERLFVPPLGRAWTEQVRDLTARMELHLRELQSLDIPGSSPGDAVRTGDLADSALARVVRAHQEILSAAIDELKIMRAIELDVIRSERAWVARTVDEIRTAVFEGTRAGGPRVGAWKG